MGTTLSEVSSSSSPHFCLAHQRHATAGVAVAAAVHADKHPSHSVLVPRLAAMRAWR